MNTKDKLKPKDDIDEGRLRTDRAKRKGDKGVEQQWQESSSWKGRGIR